jgi:cholestenol Delta-isomerase
MSFPAGRCGRLSKTDRLLMCWWAFTGLTHILIEGPFIFTPHFFKEENPNFFDEVCKSSLSSPSCIYSYCGWTEMSGWVLPFSGKEYNKGDSRYVARDAATVTVEGITAVLEGPASLLAVYVIMSSHLRVNVFLNMQPTSLMSKMCPF